MSSLTDKQISLLSWLAFGLALTLLTLVVSNAFLETQTEFVVTQQRLSEPITRRAVSPMDTATWKTYRNDQYGFEVKYPAGWGIEAIGHTGCPAEKIGLRFDARTYTQAQTHIVIRPLGVCGGGGVN